MAKTCPGRGAGGPSSASENGTAAPPSGAAAAHPTNSGHRWYTAWGSEPNRPPLARSTSTAPSSLKIVSRAERFPMRMSCSSVRAGGGGQDAAEGVSQGGARVVHRAVRAEADIAVRPDQHRTLGRDAAVLQPAAANVDVVAVEDADPGGPERDPVLGGEFLGGVDPRLALLAGDEHEVAAVDQRAERQTLAFPFHPGVGQRVPRLGARLVQTDRVERDVGRRAVIDDRRRTVRVAELHVAVAELDGLRTDGPVEGVTLVGRSGEVLP